MGSAERHSEPFKPFKDGTMEEPSVLVNVKRVEIMLDESTKFTATIPFLKPNPAIINQDCTDMIELVRPLFEHEKVDGQPRPGDRQKAQPPSETVSASDPNGDHDDGVTIDQDLLVQVAKHVLR